MTLQGKLHEAVEGLLNLEKASRIAEDITATKACCSAILAVCFSAKDWKLLEEQIMLLSKRRSQLKQASAHMTGGGLCVLGWQIVHAFIGML